MSRKMINVTVILILIYCQLMSINARRNFPRRENSEGPRVSRGIEGSNAISLKNFQRPILIQQTEIIPDDCSAPCHKLNAQVLDKKNDPTFYHGLHSMECHGWLHNCRSFSGMKGSDVPGSYCSSAGNIRWARSSNSTEYGMKDERCEEVSVPNVTKMNGFRCFTCLCKCSKWSEHSEPNANWAFNLEIQQSDIGNNRIVTGMRMRTDNEMIFLEIKESQLGSNDEGSWKSSRKMENLIPEVDYWPVKPYSRSINLDEILLPPNYVVTGLRFNKIPSPSPSQKWTIRLEVQGTELNITSGELIQNATIWYNSDNMSTPAYKHPRIPITTKNKKSPLPMNDSEEIKMTNRIVTFEITNLISDLGQFAVPYLDMSDAQSEKNVPLKGIGLSYRMKPGHAGYIIPKIFPSDVNVISNVIENRTEIRTAITNTSVLTTIQSNMAAARTDGNYSDDYDHYYRVDVAPIIIALASLGTVALLLIVSFVRC